MSEVAWVVYWVGFHSKQKHKDFTDKVVEKHAATVAFSKACASSVGLPAKLASSGTGACTAGSSTSKATTKHAALSKQTIAKVKVLLPPRAAAHYEEFHDRLRGSYTRADHSLFRCSAALKTYGETQAVRDVVTSLWSEHLKDGGSQCPFVFKAAA